MKTKLNPLVAKEIERLNLKLAEVEHKNFLLIDEISQYRYCPYCSHRLSHKIDTDANSPKVCKYALCPRTK